MGANNTGDKNERFDRVADWLWFSPPFFAEDSTAPVSMAEERQRRATAEIGAADAEATRFLADTRCPDDVKTFGANHGIPTFAEATWVAGFIAGWRLALRMDRTTT